ncbi:hypothetical protein GUJ93_ZPchr0010g8305 [Zizania palustris]|uniref:Uncharacterized protein n=1 Tax=Zizania palustris TaxID=103762 RepID=A0A8J5SZ79_ZIZPA|nr:hypothetical protein GUJ93_ZPchr0010g8305 [Zizania palustris]
MSLHYFTLTKLLRCFMPTELLSLCTLAHRGKTAHAITAESHVLRIYRVSECGLENDGSANVRRPLLGEGAKALSAHYSGLRRG